jgi:P pilus assembly chaperone PapD
MTRYIYFFTVLFFFRVYDTTGQTGMAASPMKLEFNAPPGGTQSLRVLVSNPTKGVVNVGASLSDWQRDSAGNIVLADAGRLEHSCTNWFKMLPATQFNLQPGESKEVMVLLQAPADAGKKARAGMLFLTQLNAAKAPAKEGMNINLTVRIGIQLYYTPPGLTRKEVEIEHFSDTLFAYKKDSAKARILQLRLRNTGELPADGKVNFELTDLKAGKKTPLTEQKFYTLPGALRVLRLLLPPGLAAGDYSVTALVDYGAEYELKIGELEFRQQ